MKEQEKKLLKEQLKFLQTNYNKIMNIDCLKTAEKFVRNRNCHPLETYLYNITLNDTIETAYEKILKIHTKALKKLELEIYTYKKLLKNE